LRGERGEAKGLGYNRHGRAYSRSLASLPPPLSLSLSLCASRTFSSCGLKVEGEGELVATYTGGGEGSNASRLVTVSQGSPHTAAGIEQLVGSLVPSRWEGHWYGGTNLADVLGGDLVLHAGEEEDRVGEL
jgi:hypothetical protein